MGKKKQWAQVGKRKVELSNLDKILFPEDSILKAEVVEYYLSVAPVLLTHSKYRPLTLIRFPDGIHGENFYQKDRPEWSPEWIEYISLGSEKKEYILATETATLVWLANLASLELHQMHCRRPRYDNPDYMVFDLDPPEGYVFKKVIEIAFSLKEHVEAFGYTCFVKTTGGKGLHLIVPLEPVADFNTVFDAASLIAKPFVEKYSSTTTLQIKREARHGKVLIDIYRNRNGQTIVAPYSLRGRAGAPVSMPLTWDQLRLVKSPLEFSLRSVPGKIARDGDAWEGMESYACLLHTQRTQHFAGKALAPSLKRKTPEQLQAYQTKRNFVKTPEPAGTIQHGTGNAFVVHRHHASHIHYDLRLEKDGVLRSWAVPKGLPPVPGIKRLAVQTEDHPLEYLAFEGHIPKGQYGGGDMWIFLQGRYEITKEKKDGSFYFRLISKTHSGEYRMYKIKDKEWLLERVDENTKTLLDTPPEFMLSESMHTKSMAQKKAQLESIFKNKKYTYEVKWDGIRALVVVNEGTVKIISRNHRDITHQFPELSTPESFRALCGVFDSEIVSLDSAGKPDFKKVIHRLMATGSSISKSATTHPVCCYIFDCLYLDGRSVMQDAFVRRRIWLEDIIKPDLKYRISQTEADGKALFEAAKQHQLEGIMAKHKESTYQPGKRSEAWIKIKVHDTADCVIIGYTAGKGNRASSFGALHVAEVVEGRLQYRGRVGTGFDDKLMKEITELLKKCKQTKKPIGEKVLDEKASTWVEPLVWTEIRFSSITRDKMFREPVFIRLRQDKGNE